MNIGTGPVLQSHGFPDLPVPVGADTIAPAIPGAENKPGCCREQHRQQVSLSCFMKSPPGHIEQGEHGMKNKEKNIQNSVSHDSIVRIYKDEL